MKKLHNLTFLKSAVHLLTVLLFVLFQPIIASAGTNTGFPVVFGERPPIDLQNVSGDAYYQGIIKIKFNPSFSDVLEANPPALSGEGFISFNIPGIDELNRQYEVRQVQKHFAIESFVQNFNPRHKAWGLHLWYELRFDETVDIRDMIARYVSLPEVEIAEPEFKKRLIVDPGMEWILNEIPEENTISPSWIPNDPQFGNQWHYRNTGQQSGTPGADISLQEAWDIEKGNTNVVVAIIDDGIQFNHPDLAGNMWSGIGYNFVNNTPTINPGNHGTHVAGTVSAVNNNGVGVSGVAGGSGSGDGVRLMSCQVFSGSSSGGFQNAPIWAADNGAAISQNSWGYTSAGVYEQSVLNAIDYFNANGGGAALTGGITIFAAGNDNSDGAWYPGYYSGAFSVAATNNQDKKSWYSNYGNWIDISAPGGETNTVNARGVLSTVTGSNYAYYQGTSMACPHASGVAALIVSLAYGELTATDVADILKNTTDNHYNVNPGFIGKLGTGRLNAHQALLETMNYTSGVLNPQTFSASANGPDQVNLSWVKNANNNNVLLAWSENDVFGQPDPNTNYTPGDVITGGGTVLYAGNVNSFIHSNLAPATLYFYSIWSFDGVLYSSGRSSSAATTCVATTAPFFENFDAGSLLPLCWDSESVNGTTNWEIGQGNGGSNPSNAFSAPNNAYFKQQSTSGHMARLLSPELNLPEAGSVEVKFYYTNQRRTIFWFFNYQDILRVKYNTHQNPEWQTLQTFNSNVGNWTEVTISIPNPQNIRFIAFEAESETGHGVCLDNVELIMDCIAPANLVADELTSNSATISWTSEGWESSWNLKYGLQGFNPTISGTLIEGITETQSEITNLSQQTTYDVYVQSDCGDGQTSEWEGPLGFETTQEMITQVISIPAGWSGFSTYLHPENPFSEELFAEILNEIVLVMDGQHIFFPEMGINTFGEWGPMIGAQMKLKNAATLHVDGMMPQSGSIAVAAGWNYLPVMTDCGQDIETLFKDSFDDVVVVKEIAGTNLFWPEYNINTLKMLNPGCAYLVLMTQPATLTFDECED